MTTIEFLLHRDGPDCLWCLVEVTSEGDSRGTADHIIPKSKGGRDAKANLLLSCSGCNNARGDMSVEEFLLLRPDAQVEKIRARLESAKLHDLGVFDLPRAVKTGKVRQPSNLPPWKRHGTVREIM